MPVAWSISYPAHPVVAVAKDRIDANDVEDHLRALGAEGARAWLDMPTRDGEGTRLRNLLICRTGPK